MGTTGTVTVKVLGGVPDITLKTAGFSPYGGSSTSSGTWGLERISYKAPGQNWVHKYFEMSLTYSCVPYPDTSYVGVKKYYDLTVNLRAVNGPDPELERNVNFEYRVKNEDDNPLQMRLMVDGTMKDQFGVAAGFESVGQTVLSLPEGQSGSYQWQAFVDGQWVTVDSGTYLVGSVEVPGVDPAPLDFVRQKSGGDPGPEPTPSPTPEPAPEIPETPDPDIPPTSQPAPGDQPMTPVPTGPGSGPDGRLEKNDIYESVKAAIENAGRGTGEGGSDEGSISRPELHEGGDELAEGKRLAGEIYDKYQQVTEGMDVVRDAHRSKLEEFAAALQSAPSSFGTITVVQLGAMPVVGAVSLDFSSLPHEAIRLVFLWILRLFVFLAYLKLLLS